MKVDRDETAFDYEVRRCVYDHAMQEGLPPTIAKTASELSMTPGAVEASFRRLADGHILVLQRGTGEILMANPSSAVPTPFLVGAGDHSWYGNCIWDATGIPAMLGKDATIEASCGCCGTAMRLRVVDGSLEQAPGIAHFAIPAAHWWDDRYGPDRREPEWRRWNVDETRALFTDLGLTSPFWRLPD